MARDPIMEQMAAKLAGGRQGEVMPPPRGAQEVPPQESPVAQVKAKLQEAMDMLDQLGAPPEAAPGPEV